MESADLLQNLPKELVDTLIVEFNNLHKNYFLGKWDASQLNGGRFGEVVLRILEFKNSPSGTFTPIGVTVPRKQIVTQILQNTALNNSLRLFIPPLTELIMDFRNDRSVAHLGPIEVNGMDSNFVIAAVNWIMAELVRLEGMTTPDQAQTVITKLIERKIPLIEDYGDRLKILNPRLIAKHQILAFCYYKYPQSIGENSLFLWVDEKNKTRFKKSLKELDRNKLLDYYNGESKLTRLGLKWVEKNIKFDLD
jgi:hypothetical protein